jgi:hypothetical protein
MIESSKPMSDGRAPTGVGQVGLLRDGGIYAFPVTNREVYFPYYPTEAKGYIVQGYGPNLELTSFDSFNGFVSLTAGVEDVRIVTIPGVAYYEYRTPTFTASVIQGDVIHKPWQGAKIKLSRDVTTTVNQYSPPAAPVITTITVDFEHTFSAADDPVVGSPDYVPPNTSNRTLYGVEYLYYADEPGVTTTTSATSWVTIETTPP